MLDTQKKLPIAVDKIIAESRFSDFMELCREKQITDIERLININNVRGLLYAVFSNSPYLTRLIMKDVSFTRKMLMDEPEKLFDHIIEQMKVSIPGINDISSLMKELRRAKAKVALLTAFADLSGKWPLDRITGSLTEFAELSVSLVISHLLRAEMIRGNLKVPPHLADIPLAELPANPELSRNTGYVALAMGKMGGYELNYSSDIDLIILFDNDIVQYTGRKTAQDMFIKLTRNLVKIMQERTAEGYVFRTDLRLRPDPGATAIALSMEGAEIYYQSMGLNWERAAMIKARPVAGDLQAGYDFLSRIKSFVWRKHLDYAALEDIYSIKKLIHQHHGHKNIGFAGQDIKLGYGGIREIEFYAQIFQLIAGGREPELRIAPTCKALNALEKKQKISPSDNDKLQQAYIYYRTLEHRLQMINDDQTHSLPESDDDLKRITCFMGYQNPQEFMTDLHHHRQNVHELFTSLLKDSHQEDQPDKKNDLSFPADDYNRETLNKIKSWGYENPATIYDIIQNWLLGRYRACRTERARKLLRGLLPDILNIFGKQGNPDSCFKKFDQFLSRLPSGVQLFSFITAQPWLLQLLAEIIGTAPKLSDQLAKRPLLLDAVLNHDFFESTFNKGHLIKQLEEQLDNGRDFQDILDIVRKYSSELKFQIGVQILRHKIDAETAGKNLSLVADVILESMLEQVTHEFSRKHGVIEGAEFAILALGKLGGRELTTTSDLDLVFLYDVKGGPRLSNGSKPLSVNHYFARLSQQYINALTAMTGEGRLYEIDMRLRPSGNAGPIAVTLKGFGEYQHKDAWTWEHLALTRSRVIVGNQHIRKKITGLISDAIGHKKQNPDELLRDTAEMREKLRREFGTDNIWSVKHVRGGLVDIEFICQYLILKHAAQKPELVTANNLEQVTRLQDCKILSAKQGKSLYRACEFMQNLQIILRLCMESQPKNSSMPPPMPLGLVENLCERFDMASLDQLTQKITATQKQVCELYQEIIAVPAKKL